jgi:hypothetical protein
MNVDVALKETTKIEGTVGVALVGWEMGLSRRPRWRNVADLDLAAARNIDVIPRQDADYGVAVSQRLNRRHPIMLESVT